LREVSFYLDGELMGVVSEAPFLVKFHTSDFQEGEHIMYAVGSLADGGVLESNTITKAFLSADQAWGETQQIIVPLLVGVGALTLLGLALPALLGRNKEYVVGQYGMAGGAVCPRCSLPFSRPYLAPNLMVGKLVRCPHCGKISVQPAASPSRLQEAERRYYGETDQPVISEKPGDIEKMIEDSRFED
jgi:DNA-directed RNA polymerase subunit RPC12/RpoP